MPETVGVERLALFGRGTAPAFPLRLDDALPLTADERETWERRLNRGRRACGCAEGAAGLGIGILAVAADWLVLSPPLSGSSIAATLAFPIACLATGKLIGQKLHRGRFLKACNELLQQLAVAVN